MEQWAAGESPEYLNSNSNGASKDNIKHTIERNYRYTLDYDLDALFFELEFTTNAAITVPIAIYLGLVARDPAHCLRLGLYVSGDTDSITSMATALAASFKGAQLPTEPFQQQLRYMAIHYPEFIDSGSPLHIPLHS